jgi:Dolichyl-phosphate-mannose-protein mannosyltransferase
MTTEYRAPVQLRTADGEPVTLESIISPRLAPDPVGRARPRTFRPSGPPLLHAPAAGANLARSLLRPATYYVMSRLAVLFAALAGTWLVPRLHLVRSLATAWDGSWYLRIVAHGYPHGLFNEGDGSRWAFFPAFPAAIRGVADVTGLSYDDAAVCLAFVFGLTSALAIWLAVREVFGQQVADRSVLLYVFFPASYVLSMAYTEGLFLTAAGLCLFALSRKYWITAALMAGVGSLTRDAGLALILCVVVAAVPHLRRPARSHRRVLAALLITPLPAMGWMAYCWSETGTPLAFIKAEQFWPHGRFEGFLSPFLSLLHLLSGAHGFADGQAVLATGALIFAYLGLALLLRARQEQVAIPTFWWVFTVLTLLLAMSPSSPTSVLRYTMAVFPLFAAFAWKVRPSWEGMVVAFTAMAQGALMVVVLVGSLHPNTSIIWP